MLEKREAVLVSRVRARAKAADADGSRTGQHLIEEPGSEAATAVSVRHPHPDEVHAGVEDRRLHVGVADDRTVRLRNQPASVPASAQHEPAVQQVL